jgi:phage gp37-like protein
MLTEIQGAILDRLKEIAEAAQVDVWQGEETPLLEMPQKFPALWVIYRGASFSEKKLVGGDRADFTMTFVIFLLHKNLRSRRAGAEEAYAVIESVRAKLIAYKILAYGWLWPVNEELILAESGFLGYALEYRLRTNT